MNEQVIHKEEQAAAAAFNLQAPVFDLIYGNDAIITYKRKRVREHVKSFLPEHSHILELNAGTGEDAIYFGSEGHTVHATDISVEMQNILKQKIAARDLGKRITQEICSFTELENLGEQGPYDFIFSNFAGLNCTGQLNKVLDTFSWLLKPGGYVTLVVLPKFCLWEFLLLFKGSFKTAFRRWSGKRGTKAKIENVYFRSWYYNPSYIRRHLKGAFKVVELEGLCSLVPPSYFEKFAEKRPVLFKTLVSLENKWKSFWPINVIGDYYIITLKKS